jgi:uncharacterized protein YeaO (DUF488 family)
MAKKTMIRLKRAYDAPSDDDGTRILVERLWPRGIGKEEEAIDLWIKEVAPSTELRKWYGHDPDRWEEFRLEGFLSRIPRQDGLVPDALTL